MFMYARRLKFTRCIECSEHSISRKTEFEVVPKYENGNIVGCYMVEDNKYASLYDFVGICNRIIKTPTSSASSLAEQRSFIETQCRHSEDLMAAFRQVGYVLRHCAPELWKFERIYARVKEGTITGDALFEDIGEPPKSIIMNLPFDVLNLVLERLDFMDKLVLRKTCHYLRNYLAVTPDDCKQVTVTFTPTRITLDIDEAKVEYSDEEILWKNNIKRITTPWQHQAISDVVSLLKTPNLTLTHLNLKVYSFLDKKDHEPFVDATYESLRKALNTLKTYRAHVENLEIQCRDARHVTSVARHLKQGILKKMCLKFAGANEEMDIGKFEMRKIFLLHQFKSLSEVVLDGLVIEAEEVSGFFDLPRFEVLVERMSAKAVVRMKENLLYHPAFDHCKVKFFPFQDMRKVGKLLNMPLHNDRTWGHNRRDISMCSDSADGKKKISVSL